jgi:uncharacterized membrane protein YfhO
VGAATSPGQAVLVQETFDPSWQAKADGKELTIQRDPLGFMLIATPPGAHSIHLHFGMPLENRCGWMVTGITCFIAIILIGRRRAAQRT